MNRLVKPIVLVGMMGCGKSAVGARLAKVIGVNFHDSDKVIALDQGQSIAKIFSNDGEEYFREIEARKISDLLELDNCVISTGGGALGSTQTLRDIKSKAISIWLKSDVETIFSRIKGNKTRPLLQCENPRAKLEELLKARETLYAEADIHIDNSSSHIKEVISKIERELKDYNAK